MHNINEQYARILEELGNRAPHYVPEWRFDPSSPDAGGTLAFLWASMLSGSLSRFEALPENFRRVLLDAIGSEPRQPQKARSVLVFTPGEETEVPVTVPMGVSAAVPGLPAVALTTDSDLVVSPSTLTGLYFVSPPHDLVRRYESMENLTLFETGVPEDHTWTFCHPYAFAVSAPATLRLSFSIQGENPPELCSVPWAFYDGVSWQPLEALPHNAMIRLRFPGSQTAPCTRIRFTLPGGQTGGCRLQGLRAYPAGVDLPADACYAEDIQQPDRFYPFGERFIPGLCFYAASADALGKPGAEVELSFDLQFEDFPIEGYPDMPIRRKKLMKAEDFEPPPSYEITAAKVAWEYYNGVGWCLLPFIGGGNDKLFAGEYRGRQALRFLCPEDIRPALCGAHDTFILRGRLEKADNLFRMHGRYRTPVVSNLRFRYAYPSGVPITEAELTEHLDKRPVSVDTGTPLIGGLPSGGMYFSFDKPFSDGTLMPVLASAEQERPPRVWEYHAANGFAPLDVHDETDGFTKNGIVSYHTPLPCAPTRLFGHNAYWMRLCGGEAGSGPRLRGIYENAVTATAREAGEASNRPSHSFLTLQGPIAGISRLFNPLPGAGGTDEEQEDGIIRRLTAAFSHGGRAVTPSDYEDLAAEASPRVKGARCYTDTNEQGMPERGHTSVVVLTDGLTAGDARGLHKEVGNYLEARRPPGAGPLSIVPPRETAVGISLDAAMENPKAAFTIKQHILEALSRFLHPLTGNHGKGFPLGELPPPSDLAALLRATPGLLYIRSLKVSYGSADYESAVKKPFTIPINGTHELVLS